MTDGQPESLYPERATVECVRCRCQHWADGRCFAQDSEGWPIIRRIVFPKARPPAARMTGAETKQAIRPVGAMKGEPGRWWAE